jgi:mRNA-degrading endonuclease toxin of MazEF toxin-antitoxin module
MIFDRFDLIVVSSPFVDSPRTKPCPALVLRNRDFNRANGHTVLAMVTRATHSGWASDHAIEEFGPTGLRDPSVVPLQALHARQSDPAAPDRPPRQGGCARLHHGAPNQFRRGDRPFPAG